MQLDMHSALDAAKNIRRHNVSGLAHDAAHMKKGKSSCLQKGWLNVRVMVTETCPLRQQSSMVAAATAQLQLTCAVDPNAPRVADEVRLANEQKSSNMKGTMRFLKVICAHSPHDVLAPTSMSVGV